MRKFLSILRVLFTRTDTRPLPVRKEKTDSDPVYHFFVEEKSGVRKRAYNAALKAAEQDQKEIIRRYEEARA